METSPISLIPHAATCCRWLSTSALFFAATLTEVSCTHRPPADEKYATTSGLRMNQLQVLATHNSYHVAPDTTAARWPDPRFAMVSYEHPPLPAQLDAGIRGFELDIFVDDEGGRFANPPAILGGSHDPRFEPPGFKVLHIPNVDQDSVCPTLAGCLRDLAAWSVTHPAHLPVFVQLECVAEDPFAKLPGVAHPARWEARHLDELEQLVQDTFGAHQLITPDLVRGQAPTLREAIAAPGWPLVDDVRGRFMFVITVDGHVVAKQLARRPRLRNTALFVDAGDDADDGAFRLLNNPIEDAPRIAALSARGVIVRTRTDENLVEPRSGSTARRDQALASGAVVISTDFPSPSPKLGIAYFARMPDGGTARVHPLANDPRAGRPLQP